MKWIHFLPAFALAACTPGAEKSLPPEPTPTIVDSVQDRGTEAAPAIPALEVHANERFKDVTVGKVGEHEFLIKGKGQIFEASFNWVVEDGHEELKQGYATTDAGAPEWGSFAFTVDVKKARPNSTLTLILFEASAMDGSRQHELPIVLY